MRPPAWQAARLALGTASALGLARFAYGLLLPAMRDDLHWTLTEAGAMSSAVIYGATFMGVPAAVTALIRGNTPPADWTVTLAALTTLFAAGQTAGPWIAGVVADHTSTDATLAWTAILCAVAAVIAATAGRSRPSTADHQARPDAAVTGA
jgi:predicted MFS family arabinose efflux permease